MIIVLDASAGIEIVLGRESSNRFKTQVQTANKVITTDLYKAETANVIWKYVKADLLKKENAIRSLELCLNLIDDFIDISENNEEAINESIRLNHPVYDLLYFTLARRNGAILLTLDKKLNKLSEENGIIISK
jgi:predicted nucleic acid-binding protein